MKIQRLMIRHCPTWAGLCFGCLGFLVLSTPPARGQTFSDLDVILLPGVGEAIPYPSTIDVSGLSGVVVDVSVTLNNLVRPYPDDLDVLLVGPEGQSVLLMSDAGGSSFVNGVNLTFSIDAGVMLPDSTQITGGTYEPTDYPPSDSMPSPAPGPPYGTDLGVFHGSDPNGSWHLYVFDDFYGADGGEIAGGWSLTLEVGEPPTFQTQPQDVTVSPGGTAGFGVFVNGTPPLGYQWLRNGEVFDPFGSGGFSLIITNVQTTNAGHYSVVVTNKAAPQGIESESAYLNVLGPLALVDSPQTQVLTVGETAVFQVTAPGTPPVHHQWRRNGALIEGQTNSTLVVTNAQINHGGTYSVTVWNGDDAITSDSATLTVATGIVIGYNGRDNFEDRASIIPNGGQFNGVERGAAASATAEPGEPMLGGIGKSLWWEWTAPWSGVVTLSTLGSEYDTVLGVFTGTSVSNLTLVAQDDDLGGAYTSSLQFNAQGGVPYQWRVDGVAVDGVGSGRCLVSWNLLPIGTQTPVVVVPPEPVGVARGSNATFTVTSESPGSDAYQWLFNGIPITGAVNSFLTISNAASTNVGFYSVRITDVSGAVIESPAAALNVGLGFSQRAQDKPPSPNLPGVISVALGDFGSNEFPSEADGDPTEVNPCDSPFLRTLFQGVRAEDNGVIQVDTTGSEVFVLLAVYEGVPGLPGSNPEPVACDVLSAGANQPCLVQYDATAETDYTAVVAILNAAGTERIQVNAALGIAPPIPSRATCVAVPPGASQLLQVPNHGWVPAPSVQWRFNGQDIPGATNSTLLLTNFDVTLAGSYSVVLSNFVAVSTTAVSHVSVSGPPLLQASLQEGFPSPHLVILGSADQPFVLQTSLQPNGPWSDVATNPTPCFVLRYTNAGVLLDAQRFFRARLSTPPEP